LLPSTTRDDANAPQSDRRLVLAQAVAPLSLRRSWPANTRACLWFSQTSVLCAPTWSVSTSTQQRSARVYDSIVSCNALGHVAQLVVVVVTSSRGVHAHKRLKPALRV